MAFLSGRRTVRTCRFGLAPWLRSNATEPPGPGSSTALAYVMNGKSKMENYLRHEVGPGLTLGFTICHLRFTGRALRGGRPEQAGGHLRIRFQAAHAEIA